MEAHLSVYSIFLCVLFSYSTLCSDYCVFLPVSEVCLEDVNEPSMVDLIGVYVSLRYKMPVYVKPEKLITGLNKFHKNYTWPMHSRRLFRVLGKSLYTFSPIPIYQTNTSKRQN